MFHDNTGNHLLSDDQVDSLLDWVHSLPPFSVPFCLINLNLGHKSVARIISIFSKIPSYEQELNLMQNSFGDMADDALPQAIERLVTVKKLLLCSNELNKKSGFSLANAFKKLSSNVDTLWLRYNDLGSMSGAGLAVAFSGIPSTVKILHLSGNLLNQMPVEELNHLKDSLQHVQTVYLGLDEVQAMSPEQCNALRGAFPHAQRVIFYDDEQGCEYGGNSLPIKASLARRLGFPFADGVESLLNLCSFFVKESGQVIDGQIPKNLKDHVQHSWYYPGHKTCI